MDRLCDRLNGRGVPNLNDELVNLELRPVHDALRQLLEPGTVNAFADLAEPGPSSAGQSMGRRVDGEQKRFFEQTWARTEGFLYSAQAAYITRRAREGSLPLIMQPADPATLANEFRQALRAALRLPVIESLLPSAWTSAALRVLPSSGKQSMGAAVWGPILGWCILRQLAKSVDAKHPERAALDLFDRLRLREPFAQAFSFSGFEGEAGWRVAARIKVLLLTEAEAGRVEPATQMPTAAEIEDADQDLKQGASLVPGDDFAVGDSGEREENDLSREAELAAEFEADRFQAGDLIIGPPSSGMLQALTLSAADSNAGHLDIPLEHWPATLWLDPDIRWLTGAHEAEGHTYVIREHYEELLWWLKLPELLKLAAEAQPTRAAVVKLSERVTNALFALEAAGYRIDALTGSDSGSQSQEDENAAPVQERPEEEAKVSEE